MGYRMSISANCSNLPPDFSKFLLTICRWKKSADWTLFALTRIRNITSNCAPYFVLTIIRVYSEVRLLELAGALHNEGHRELQHCNTSLRGIIVSRGVPTKFHDNFSNIWRGTSPNLTFLKVLAHLRIY